LDAFDVKLSVCTYYISNLCTFIEKGSIQLSFGLAGTGGTPRPNTVLTAAGKFNLNASWHNIQR